MAFFGLFRIGEPADGAVPALEKLATGIDPTMSDAATSSAPSSTTGRRERAADNDGDVVAEALGTKVLHGWLQNRHQTLMPLSLNLSVMSRDQREGLARILASLLVAGRPAADAVAFAPVLRAWLAGLGADADMLGSYDAAVAAPLPLNVVFDVAQGRELTIYAYVAALMASDSRYPVSVMLCDMVQARFDLPTAMVRSAIRRYRR